MHVVRVVRRTPPYEQIYAQWSTPEGAQRWVDREDLLADPHIIAFTITPVIQVAQTYAAAAQPTDGDPRVRGRTSCTHAHPPRVPGD
jgi:hypothetical protein